jgi:hypothetical protein
MKKSSIVSIATPLKLSPEGYQLYTFILPVLHNFTLPMTPKRIAARKLWQRQDERAAVAGSRRVEIAIRTNQILQCIGIPVKFCAIISVTGSTLPILEYLMRGTIDTHIRDEEVTEQCPL